MPWNRCGLPTAFLFAGCALQIDDPEDALRRKLEKPHPVSFSALLGRWMADSTYALDDPRATRLESRGVLLDFLPDSTFQTVDPEGSSFPGNPAGSFRLLRDSLSLRVAATPELPALASMRFLGNYLTLYFPTRKRYVLFHKSRPPDSLEWKAWLQGRWLATAKRGAAPGPAVPEALRSRFDYRLVSADTLTFEVNDRGILARSARRFILADSADRRRLETDDGGSFFLQWLHPDSLRLWPMRQGRADSGFTVFARRNARHPLDLDCKPLLQYWRGDSVRLGGRGRVLHFEDYFDFSADSMHGVTVVASAADLPRYRNWDLDSGRLVLLADGIRHPFSILRSSTSLALTGAGHSLNLHFTAADSAALRADPMVRFPKGAYVRAAIAPDSLKYFWFSNYRNADPEQFELFRPEGTDTFSVIGALPRGSSTYSPTTAGFRFALSGRIAALGRFTCAIRSGHSFVLRIASSGDPLLLSGTFLGSCQVLAAERPGGLAPDSVLSLSGDFRWRRENLGPLRSPLWNP